MGNLSDRCQCCGIPIPFERSYRCKDCDSYYCQQQGCGKCSEHCPHIFRNHTYDTFVEGRSKKRELPDLEFVVTGPGYDAWAWSRDLVWGKLFLKQKGKTLHQCYFLLKSQGPNRSDWYYTFQLLPYMEQLVQSYFSTNRGLNP